MYFEHSLNIVAYKDRSRIEDQLKEKIYVF